MEELIREFTIKCRPLSFEIGKLVTWQEIEDTNKVKLYFVHTIYAAPGIVSSYQTRTIYMTRERMKEIVYGNVEN